MSKRKIKTKAEAFALAYFLKKEALRHQEDIVNILADLRALEAKWKIDWIEIEIEDGEFVEV